MNKIAAQFFYIALLSICICSFSSGQARIIGGLSIPVGPFAGHDSATGGFAKTGFSIGVEYVTKFFFNTEIGISGLICWQPYDIAAAVRSQPNLPSGMSVSSDPWVLLWPMLNFGYSYDLTQMVTVYSRVHVGGFYGFYPENTAIDKRSARYTQNTAIDVAFGYGGGLGAVINKKFDVGVRLLSARTYYDVNVQASGLSTNEKQLRSTTVVEVTVGYVF